MRGYFGAIVPTAVIGLILGAAALAPAQAIDKSQNIPPQHAESIDLGYVTGVAYYTPEREGFNVVATLSVAGGAPVRVSTTLQPEQRMTVSVPGQEGSDAKQIEIYRRGDLVTISRPSRLVLY